MLTVPYPDPDMTDAELRQEAARQLRLCDQYREAEKFHREKVAALVPVMAERGLVRL